MATAAVHLAAAVAETAGRFAFRAWARLDRSAPWMTRGIAALAAFAWLLTLGPAALAGRACRRPWRRPCPRFAAM